MNLSILILPLCGAGWAAVFAGLKLAGVIAWSWLWVTAPLWGAVAITVGVPLACFVFAGFALLVDAARGRQV